MLPEESTIKAISAAFLHSGTHGDLLATLIGVEVRHACLFVKHSLVSCTSSEAHTGLDVAGQVGQIHSD